MIHFPPFRAGGLSTTTHNHSHLGGSLVNQLALRLHACMDVGPTRRTAHGGWWWGGGGGGPKGTSRFPADRSGCWAMFAPARWGIKPHMALHIVSLWYVEREGKSLQCVHVCIIVLFGESDWGCVGLARMRKTYLASFVGSEIMKDSREGEEGESQGVFTLGTIASYRCPIAYISTHSDTVGGGTIYAPSWQLPSSSVERHADRKIPSPVQWSVLRVRVPDVKNCSQYQSERKSLPSVSGLDDTMGLS